MAGGAANCWIKTEKELGRHERKGDLGLSGGSRFYLEGANWFFRGRTEDPLNAVQLSRGAEHQNRRH